MNVALSAGASIELNYSLLPNYVSYMSTPVYTVLSEAAMRPKLVVEYTLPADTSHDDAADVGANLLSPQWRKRNSPTSRGTRALRENTA